MKKGTRALALLLVFVLVLSACGPTASNDAGSAPAPDGTEQPATDDGGEAPTAASSDGKILRMALEQDIETLDSQQNTADYTAAVAEGITSSLLREHNGEYVFDMAESYTTDDYINWTFTIREDAAWSDGTPITAHDFEYSWKQIFHRDEAGKVYGFFEGMKNYANIVEAMGEGKTGADLTAVTDTLGVSAVDDRTLVVELESARPWYLANFASTYFAPIHKEIYEANGSKYGSSMDKMAYNGPFYVSDWKYNESVTLAPNPHYFDKNIALDGVEIYIVKDVEPRVNMFRDGQVNFARANSEYYTLMADDVAAYGGSSWSYILTNQHRLDADGNVVNQAISDLLANRDFVDAISYSIDREVLYSAVITDPTRFATNIIVDGAVPLNNGGDETFEQGRARRGYQSPVSLTADPEKAAASLQKAMDALGYSDVSQIPTINLVVAQVADSISVCEFVSLSVEQAIGVKLEVEAVEFGVRDSRIISGDYDLLLMGWGLDYPDARSIYEVWYTDLFATGWPAAHPDQHAAFVAMMDQIGSTSDFAARGEVLLDIEALLLDQGPFITMNLAGHAALMTKDVHDFYIRDAGTRFDYIYATID